MHPKMWMHPETCPGGDPEFLPLLSPPGEENHPAQADDAGVAAVRQSTPLLAWLPSAVPSNAQGHRATTLSSHQSPCASQEPERVCVGRTGKRKDKVERDKKLPWSSYILL